jgi:hypothetical protein
LQIFDQQKDKTMKTKSESFTMRLGSEDQAVFAEVARRLKVSRSEALRRMASALLETLKAKEESTTRQPAAEGQR